ncbi:hypothetical protein, partial [Streptococcus suis]|uniref:hypothetical protein n=1 Tax=Streptococcus suis TaxID=1307 RepID=UPI001EDD3B7D
RPICHGRKKLREHVNRKRFQSRQDFGTFSIYLVIGRLLFLYEKNWLEAIIKVARNQLSNDFFGSIISVVGKTTVEIMEPF